MTSLRDALRRVDEICPCADHKAAGGCCTGSLNPEHCVCCTRMKTGTVPCTWPGHAAARDLARAAAEWAATVLTDYTTVEEFDKALVAILDRP